MKFWWESILSCTKMLRFLSKPLRKIDFKQEIYCFRPLLLTLWIFTPPHQIVLRDPSCRSGAGIENNQDLGRFWYHFVRTLINILKTYGISFYVLKNGYSKRLGGSPFFLLQSWHLCSCKYRFQACRLLPRVEQSTSWAKQSISEGFLAEVMQFPYINAYLNRSTSCTFGVFLLFFIRFTPVRHYCGGESLPSASELLRRFGSPWIKPPEIGELWTSRNGKA